MPRCEAPPIAAFGETCAKSPISTSCSTTAAVFTITPLPTLALGLMTALAITTVPEPSCAEADTHAVGCTTLTSSAPQARHFKASCFLTRSEEHTSELQSQSN